MHLLLLVEQGAASGSGDTGILAAFKENPYFLLLNLVVSAIVLTVVIERFAFQLGRYRVNSREFFAQVKGQRDPKRVLFLGALDWRPNVDAIDLLLDKIFPRVYAQEPGAKLVIVGRHPPASLSERVRQTPGVELHADVADVRPYLGECGVMAVPLRIGGGLPGTAGSDVSTPT